MKRSAMQASPSATRFAARSTSRRAFQPLQRFEELRLARLGLGALLALLLDHLFRRPLDEARIAELGVDPLYVGLGPGDLLLEPRALGGEIDHALERQRRHLAAHQELHRAL